MHLFLPMPGILKMHLFRFSNLFKLHKRLENYCLAVDKNHTRTSRCSSPASFAPRKGAQVVDLCYLSHVEGIQLISV